MSQLYLRNALIYQSGVFSSGNLLCSGGTITALGNVPNDGAPELDCGGLRLIPGFIDAHTHGGMGVDVSSATPQQLLQVAAFFAAQGTTAWLASILTDTSAQTLHCIDNIRSAMGRTGSGAELLGVHLEGPFLAPAYKGAMPEYLLQKGNLTLLRHYLDAGGGAVKYITVSPEVEGVPQIISEIADKVVVAIGHSGADYDLAMDAIRRGARCCTHTFNGMKLFHQHAPAIMGAVLESDVWCEAICDGRHLHPGTVRLLLKTKGYDKVIAVTDSIMAAGLPDGNYKLGVNDVVVEDGDAKLATTGTRAGSTLTAIQALRNLLCFTGETLEQVLPLLTCNVAQALRMADKKGSLCVGKDADMVLLTDDLQVAATIVGGTVVYQNR